ncbi:hypothetical protein FHR92_002961 [Fontibacillus solani]|uniref:Copper amine oxidase-like N-terminal domain-containing protein n=1 Tax=Fontibacillus solani TaxID=1572857 RepID=A0A7W3SV17_9BACL|nr:copper amine oxidase N-terminal domain-containing protein [Fontibacillus solani]MBA9086483.1 hypothetical protein [Fontibacillus solani]
MRKFKTKLVLSLLSLMVVLSGIVSLASAAASTVTVQLDGKTIKFPDAKPYYENNRVMIPVRFVSEALGAKVSYKKTTSGTKEIRTVNIELGAKKISMNINSKNVLVGDKVVTLDVPARLQQDRTFVPLRFVSEALGADVKWNQSKKLVSISTGTVVTDPDPVAEAYGKFDWKGNYTKLAQKVFINNMKIVNGKLTFTLPEGAEGSYEATNGNGTLFEGGKTYTYSLSDTGYIGISLIYPGKTEQEAYMIYFPGSEINYNPKLAATVTNISPNDVLIFTHTIDGKEVAGTLTEVQKLAASL